MKLEEAIKHCEEVADEKKKEACNLYDAKNYEESRECIWCAEEHRQLAEWLRELKEYRDDCDYKTLKIKLENAEDIIRGLQEDLRDAREELRWR